MNFYLFVVEDGTVIQKELLNDDAIDQAYLRNVDDGSLDIYRLEPGRGFCRALVGPDEADEELLVIDDWVRVRLHVS